MKNYHERGKLVQGYQIIEHPLYKTYHNMKARCYNKNSSSYENYGGRGIKVCRRWLRSFENFVKDMGERPDGCSIDRINNDKGYRRRNCRWATRQVQNNNKRTYKTSKTSRTGIRLTEGGGFQVRTIGSNRKMLGVFKTMDEALEAQKNGIKQTKPRLTNTTGLTGVSRHANGSFMVRKVIDGKRVYLGNVETIEDAKKLYESGIKQSKKKGGNRDEKGRYTSKD